MLKDVSGCGGEHAIWVIVEFADRVIARSAEDAADFPGLVAVIYAHLAAFYAAALTAADGAAALRFKDSLELRLSNSVLLYKVAVPLGPQVMFSSVA